MQRVTLYAIVVAGQTGVGIVRRANPDLMPAIEAQAETDAVFELEGTAELVVFVFGVGEQRHTDPGFDVRFDRLTGKLVNEHRRERQAVVAGSLVTFPVGVSAAPVAGQATYAALPPAVLPPCYALQA